MFWCIKGPASRELARRVTDPLDHSVMTTNKPKNTQDKSQPEGEHPESHKDSMREMMKQLQPLIDFHKASESLTKDDLRMFWSVTILQGGDTPFVSIEGSTSLPGALARNMVARAPGNIEKEVAQKITIPLMMAVEDKIGPPELESISPKTKAPEASSEGSDES